MCGATGVEHISLVMGKFRHITICGLDLRRNLYHLMVFGSLQIVSTVEVACCKQFLHPVRSHVGPKICLRTQNEACVTFFNLWSEGFSVKTWWLPHHMVACGLVLVAYRTSCEY